jgi:LacI family transcriptional regulator
MVEKSSKITMIDIARASGVSLSTVSLALNEKPGLPPETRLKVQNAARQLGYAVRVPTPPARKPCLIQTVGVLVKRAQDVTSLPASNISFSHIIAGIETACRQENIALLFSTLPVDSRSSPMEIHQLVQDKRINALLLVGSDMDDAVFAALPHRKIPIVLVEAYCRCCETDSIVIDNHAGAYNAVKYLIEQGNRHIAFIGSQPHSSTSFYHRQQGYMQALRDHGITTTYIADCPTAAREDVIAATRDLLTQSPQISAIFGCSDDIAIIAMHGVLETGKKVPDDISIIGFENNSSSENSIPPLTTVQVDHAAMGRLAVQMLINRAEYPQQSYITMRIHTRLIERQSVRRKLPA